MLDVDEDKAEYLLIAENWERRGKAESDPIKVSRILKFLEDYWKRKGEYVEGRGNAHNAQLKSESDLAEFIGETRRTTQRILKLHDLIPQLQRLVSAGKLGTTAGGANVTNEIKGGGIANQSQVFDYKQVDGQTADFLRLCEGEIEETLGQAATRIGGILKKAQERLAKKGYGCYYEWSESIGIHRKKAERLTNRYELITTNCRKQELIEDLPVSLTYEIAKPSAESSPEKAQAKSEVLAGDIATLKEYRDRIAELEGRAKQAERQADIERSQRERLEEEVEHLSEREPETVTEYIEVTPEDYEQIKKERDNF